MNLHIPRYLALDTSHLTQWAHDRTAANADVRQVASNFEAWAENNGYVFLLTLHHIEELLNHDDPSRAYDRLKCLSELKMVSWIGDQESGPGGITTIATAEARYILSSPEATALEVREAIRSSLIRFGTGADLLGNRFEDWLALRPLVRERAKEARELVALAHTDVVDNSSQPMSELLNGSVRSGDELQRRLDLIRGSFALDIERRGDRRITDPQGLASAFMQDVKTTANGLPQDATRFVLQSLARQGVIADDIRPGSTVGEMLDLGVFRSQLSALLEEDGVSGERLRRIQMSQMPTWLIQRAMKRFSPQPKYRDGSELNDFYLACLSAYADVTFVDKRVLEGFRQAKTKLPSLSDIIRQVERAARYDRIPNILAGA